MLKYIVGFLKNIFNPAVKFLAFVDNISLIDKKSKIYRFTRIIKSNVGKYSYIGNNSLVVNTAIGNFCSIASNVNIGLASHTINNISTSPIFTEKHNATKYCWTDINLHIPCARTTIGNDVWIGANVMIKSGISIGNGSIIGAGSIITKDVPPYAVVVGIPGKIIKYRFDDETIEKLQLSRWWDKSDDILKAHIVFFQLKRELLDINKFLIEMSK